MDQNALFHQHTRLEFLKDVSSVSCFKKVMSFKKTQTERMKEEEERRTHAINERRMTVKVDLAHQIVEGFDFFLTVIDTSVELVGDDLDDDIGRPDWI